MAAKHSTPTTHHSLFSIPYSLFPIHHSLFTTRARSARGQALVEYAIIFPLQLMLTLAVIQLAHIFVAKQVLEYAAFCGARAALVGLSDEEARRAAAIPISRIAGPSGVTTPDEIEIPGWGTLGRYGAALEKTLVEIGRPTPSDPLVIRCELTHDYELRVPVGNFVIYKLGEVFPGAYDLYQKYGAPHLEMKASCLLAQPWEE